MTYSYAQLEGFWEQAGGPADVAPIMAAIADAESAGRDVIQKGQPYSTTGWGLWQITPGNSVPSVGIDNALLDPVTNAKAAVAKYHSQGLHAWTTYNTGAYKQYYQGGTVPTYNGDPGITAQPGVTQASANAVQTGLTSTVLGWLLNGLGVSDAKDLAERAALMVLGAILLIIGILRFTGKDKTIIAMGKEQTKDKLKQVEDSKKNAEDTTSDAADESSEAAESTAGEAAGAGEAGLADMAAVAAV